MLQSAQTPVLFSEGFLRVLTLLATQGGRWCYSGYLGGTSCRIRNLALREHLGRHLILPTTQKERWRRLSCLGVIGVDVETYGCLFKNRDADENERLLPEDVLR